MLNRIFAIILLSAFILPAFAVTKVRAADVTSIAVVDVEKILAEAKAAQSLQKQIKAKKESFQKEFSEKEKQLKATETELAAAKDKDSAEEFGKKRKAYEEKILETRKLFQKRRNALDEGLATAMKELRKNIIESTSQVADGKGFDVVLNRESVLIASKSLDITADVLKNLDDKITEIKLKVE